MASAIMRGWEHIGYNKETGTIIAIARKSVIFARSIDYGVTWSDIKLQQPTFANDIWYSGIACDPSTGTWVVTAFNGKPLIISIDDGLSWVAVPAFLFGVSSSNCWKNGVCRFSSVCFGNGVWVFGLERGIAAPQTAGSLAKDSMKTGKGAAVLVLTTEELRTITSTSGFYNGSEANSAYYPYYRYGTAFESNHIIETQIITHNAVDNLFLISDAAYSSSSSTIKENQSQATTATCVGPRRDLNVFRMTKLSDQSKSFIGEATNTLDQPNHNTHLCFDESEKIFVGIKNYKYVVTSEDNGINWTPSLNPLLETFNPNPQAIDDDHEIKSIAAAEGVIIATLNTLSDKIYRSIDRGNTWTQIAISEPGIWTVKYCGNRFIMVGFNSNKTARSLTVDEV